MSTSLLKGKTLKFDTRVQSSPRQAVDACFISFFLPDVIIFHKFWLMLGCKMQHFERQ